MSDHARAVRLAVTALDFDLTPEERAELERHRSDCDRCRESDDTFRADAAALHRLPRRDAPSRLRQAVADAAWRGEQARSRTGLLLLVAAILMLAMAIGGGLAASQWLQRDDGATIPAKSTVGTLPSDVPLGEGPVSLIVDTAVGRDGLAPVTSGGNEQSAQPMSVTDRRHFAGSGLAIVASR